MTHKLIAELSDDELEKKIDNLHAEIKNRRVEYHRWHEAASCEFHILDGEQDRRIMEGVTVPYPSTTEVIDHHNKLEIPMPPEENTQKLPEPSVDEIHEFLDAFKKLDEFECRTRLIRGHGAFNSAELPIPAVVTVMVWLKKKADG
jgi:hypothetical protein